MKSFSFPSPNLFLQGLEYLLPYVLMAWVESFDGVGGKGGWAPEARTYLGRPRSFRCSRAGLCIYLNQGRWVAAVGEEKGQRLDNVFSPTTNKGHCCRCENLLTAVLPSRKILRHDAVVWWMLLSRYFPTRGGVQVKGCEANANQRKENGGGKSASPHQRRMKVETK